MTKARKPKAPPLTPEEKERRRWERSAERDRERQMKRHPLFVVTGAVKLQTPEERRARHEAGLVLSAQRDAAEKQRHAERLAAARDKVVALATPNALAALDARFARFPVSMRPELYEEAFLELTGQPSQAGQAVAAYQESRARVKLGARAIREGRAKQIDLFAPAFGEDRRARGDDPIPGPEAFAEQPVPPCADCGWDRAIPASALAFNLHPATCPTLRGLLLGMSEACADCKALPRGCCPAHRARCLACDAEGHLPHWPATGYRSLVGRPYCARCGVVLPSEALAKAG